MVLIPRDKEFGILHGNRKRASHIIDNVVLFHVQSYLKLSIRACKSDVCNIITCPRTFGNHPSYHQPESKSVSQSPKSSNIQHYLIGGGPGGGAYDSPDVPSPFGLA